MRTFITLLMLFIGLISFTAVSCTTTPTEQKSKIELKKESSTSVVTPVIVPNLVSSQKEHSSQAEQGKKIDIVREKETITPPPKEIQPHNNNHYSGQHTYTPKKRPILIRPRIVRSY